MSEIRVNSIGNESNTGGPVLSGITTFSGQQYFIPPKGTTAERPSDCPPGSIRFNTDTSKLEYWQGTVWLEFEASSVELADQNQTNSAGGLGARGIIAGGNSAPQNTNSIDYISITTLGNSQEFGDLFDGAGFMGGAVASTTRCIFGGGYTGAGKRNVIQFVTISSTGNSEDFGDMTADGNTGRTSCGGVSDSTRGVFCCGQNSNGSPYFTNTLSYITMASNGNDVEFGDCSNPAFNNALNGVSNGTRALFSTGGGPASARVDYINIQTTGNSIEFGTQNVGGGGHSATTGNKTRGIWGGGYSGRNEMGYVTISTLGDTVDFGDLTQGRFEAVGLASPTRGVYAGGTNHPGTPTINNTIDYVEIMTTGNAREFGDLSYMSPSTQGRHVKGHSNGHGGL
jgi:hypothetical protein